MIIYFILSFIIFISIYILTLLLLEINKLKFKAKFLINYFCKYSREIKMKNKMKFLKVTVCSSYSDDYDLYLNVNAILFLKEFENHILIVLKYKVDEYRFTVKKEGDIIKFIDSL